jgi:hypothetical protein
LACPASRRRSEKLAGEFSVFSEYVGDSIEISDPLYFEPCVTAEKFVLLDQRQRRLYILATVLPPLGASRTRGHRPIAHCFEKGSNRQSKTRCLKPANLSTSAIYKPALPFVSVNKARRSRRFREKLIRLVVGCSMWRRPHISWRSCGWLSDVAFWCR